MFEARSGSCCSEWAGMNAGSSMTRWWDSGLSFYTRSEETAEASRSDIRMAEHRYDDLKGRMHHENTETVHQRAGQEGLEIGRCAGEGGARGLNCRRAGLSAPDCPLGKRGPSSLPLALSRNCWVYSRKNGINVGRLLPHSRARKGCRRAAQIALSIQGA